MFTIQKIEKQLQEIRATIYRQVNDIPSFKFFEKTFGEAEPEDPEGPQCPEFNDQNWPDLPVGSYWGGYDRLAWFRTWVRVPEAMKDQKVALRFRVGPRDGGGSTAEAMLYVNGHSLQALDVWHEEAWLPPEYLKPEQIFIAIKAWSGVLDVPERRQFKTAQIVQIDCGAEALFHRANAVLQSITQLDENDLRRVRLLKALNDAFLQIDFLKKGSEAYYQSLADAGLTLDQGLERAAASNEARPKVIGIGHAHIDVAWLWRVRHSREKAARTFSTALHLMRQYPEYRFLHSTPYLYRALKADYPDLYARVKQKIATGQWEINGGMWVEADTNIPSGESLVRQLLLGKRFVEEEFGIRMKTLWLPDVFGYPAALPQILRRSGLETFLTTKISWSQFNRFPYDTFRWRGIDGSEILTHFVTTPEKNSSIYTYNGNLEPAQVKGLWDNYRQKEVNDELITLFGWGDGGGGPTQGMLESALALKNMPGMPEVRLGSAGDFLERLESHLAGQPLPVWDGELYLEYHRGTYTSQAANKRLNRQAEVLYHNAEWLSAFGEAWGTGVDYPAEELRKGWELILLNQFHDILPGSSIHEVYEDSRADYQEIERLGRAAWTQAEEAFANQLSLLPGDLLVMNPLSWDRTGLVEAPLRAGEADKWTCSSGGIQDHFQVIQSGEGQSVLVEAASIPAMGYRVIDLNRFKTGEPIQEAHWLNLGQEASIWVTKDLLENAFYRIRIDENGQITSLWDKRRGREVLAVGARGNVLQAFEDKPLNFDAWDIDIYYQEKMREVGGLVEAKVEETGPLRGTLRLTWKFSGSTICQRIHIYRSSPRIDFRTEIDWHEHQVLLKAAFPVAVRATRATYGIQFGSIERPTHWNTSWDWARFEVAGHQWADLSEGDYGVALLSDCKYGYDVKDQVLRLTLIKSGINPDPQADQGRHIFTYSLLPHPGDWREGQVALQAQDLGDPLHAFRSGAGDGSFPKKQRFSEQDQFVSVNCEHVLVDTVKKAEDGGGWVVRVYEFQQCRNPDVTLRFGKCLRQAVECNLMEEVETGVQNDGSSLTFSIAPFEIRTFKVWFQD